MVGPFSVRRTSGAPRLDRTARSVDVFNVPPVGFQRLQIKAYRFCDGFQCARHACSHVTPAADQHLCAALDQTTQLDCIRHDPILHISPVGDARERGLQMGQPLVGEILRQFALIENLMQGYARPVKVHRASAGVVSDEARKRPDPDACPDQDQ
jgi:hypothetical protein